MNVYDRETEIDALMAKHKEAKAKGYDLPESDKLRLLELLLEWQLRGTIGYETK